jgi:hypothetical protein
VKPIRRPVGGFGYDGIRVLSQGFGVWPECWIAGIADCGQDVSYEAIAADPFDGRAGEHRAEFGIVQGCEVR